MNGVERDTRMLQDLGRYAEMNPAEIARAVGVHKTTIWRPAMGKAESRLSQPVLDKLRARFPHFGGWGDYLASDTQDSDAVAAAYTVEELSWLDLLRGLMPADLEMVLALARRLDRDRPPARSLHEQPADFWDAKQQSRKR